MNTTEETQRSRAAARTRRAPRSRIVALRALGALALVASLAGGAHAQAQAGDVVAAYRQVLPAKADDAAWNDVPTVAIPLVPQDMVEPRLVVPSTPEVEVQAVTDAARVAFRLRWADTSADDVADVSRFSDACAVQVPAAASADLPAPQMGEAGKAVDITYWRAAWQAVVDGREDSVRALHPGAAVDHYPFEAPSLRQGSEEQLAMEKRYAPARNLDNAMAGPRTQPVQDLVGEGPGTLRPAPQTLSTGDGKRIDGRWAVVLTRPTPAGLAPSGRTQVAFAVWQGTEGEVGARKMRSVWVPLALEAKP